jgi:hypothetical protein
MSPEDVLLSYGEIIQVHRKVKQSWYNTRNQTSGPSVERILDRGLAVSPKLCSLNVQETVNFYDKMQELSAAYLLPLMPFDAICLEFNFEGLFIPGLGIDRYAECASALMEILPRLLLTLYSKVLAKVLSVWVESKNRYDLLWRILELTVTRFDPTLPLEQPRWTRDMDLLEFSCRHELYFHLQEKWKVYFSSHHCMGIFLRAVASLEYADIVTNIQSNIDAYRNPDDDNFLPQHFRLTNVATLIHNSAKAQVQDIGYPCINQVSGWDSIHDIFDDDKLALCHVQGYRAWVLAVGTTCGRGPVGCTSNHRGSYCRHGFDNDCRQDCPDTSDDRCPPALHGQFARTDQRQRSFLPGV